ncbi:MAG: DUF5320 domain-containing protein [Pelotomaculum sp.]
MVNKFSITGGWGRGFRRFWGRGFGRGWGHGLGMGFGFEANQNPTTLKEALELQKEQLQNAINAIDKRLESL